ncbi:MAG TPA: efflux RND transporter periplasmic adaptor subunit [Planctomicrobium sp.]|nr:efflux RND transporter periplasmic adaptor subunit [Planctomicrobium sp.]
MNITSCGQTKQRWHRWGGLLCLLLAGGCTPTATKTSESSRPVKTMVVSTGENVRIRSFPGRVDASRRVELAFQVPGLLVELPVTEGQRVAKGEVIGRLRQTEFEARLETLQGELDQARAELIALQRGEREEERLRRDAQLRAAEARLVNTRSDHERQSRLYQQGAATRTAFENAETAYRVAQEDHQSALQLVAKGTSGREEDIQAREARVRALEARVVEASLHLQDSTLRAPYDGVIAQRFVEQGQNVQAKEAVVRFQDVDEIEIVMDVPESVMTADVQLADILQMTAEISGAPGLRFPVRLGEIAQVADPTTQTFAVRVAMEAPDGVRVLPGMTANVSMTYRRAQVLGYGIQVPVTAVMKSSDGEQVAWVLQSDDTVTRRPVQLRSVTGSSVEVVDGLSPGDRVVVAGVKFLREGMPVRDLGDALGSTAGGNQP